MSIGRKPAANCSARGRPGSKFAHEQTVVGAREHRDAVVVAFQMPGEHRHALRHRHERIRRPEQSEDRAGDVGQHPRRIEARMPARNVSVAGSSKCRVAMLNHGRSAYRRW